MSEEKQKRVRVGLEDFLRVAVVQRSQFDTMQAAAEKLGLTESSFKQRLTKEKKAYPEIFEGVQPYRSSSNGNKRASKEQAMEMLNRLQAEQATE
jgi:hypothetical protein